MIKNTSKYSHSLMVSAIMHKLAEKLEKTGKSGKLLVYSTT